MISLLIVAFRGGGWRLRPFARTL